MTYGVEEMTVLTCFKSDIELGSSYTHTVCMTTQALYLSWNPLKRPSHPLYMSSHTLCRRHHTYWVWRHRWHMYAIICATHDIISTLYDISPYYLWYQMLHYIHYITHIIYDISSTLYDVTFTMCVTSHNDSLYDIKPYLFMTYSLDLALHSVVMTQPLCAFTATMPEITLSVFLTLHRMYQLYKKKWMYVITAYICITPYALHMTLPPGFMASHHFIYDVKSTISNITFTLSDNTSTVSMSSHPLSQWYHSHPMYDITYSIHMTSYPLYLWHHIHYVRQQSTVCCWYHTRYMCDIICTTDDITSTLSQQTGVYDVTSTTGMTSHPLY